MITEKEFDSVLVKFLIDEPYFASIIRSMRKICSPEIKTAGVSYSDGAINLYWSPEFVSNLSTQKIFGLLKHECYHVIFKHITHRSQKPHHWWNIATDLAINSIIPASELPAGGLIPGKLPTKSIKKDIDDKNHIENIDKFSKFIASLPAMRASEWYMDQIRNNKEVSDAIDQLYDNDLLIDLDVHSNQELSEADASMANELIKKTLENAKNIANNRNWGSVPHKIKEDLLSRSSTEFDWQRALKYFCGSKLKTDYSKTYKRINRKYPYIHAGRKSKNTSMLAVYIDQSGSVGNAYLEKFGAALEVLSKTHTFVYYYFDANVDVDSKTTWKKGKTQEFKRTLMGGTDFGAVENHFRTISKDFDGCIVMTDGLATKPPPCISKRCWVLTPGGKLSFSADKKDKIINIK